MLRFLKLPREVQGIVRVIMIYGEITIYSVVLVDCVGKVSQKETSLLLIDPSEMALTAASNVFTVCFIK